MTLKEKFDSISCNDCDMPYCDVKCTILSDYELNKLEKIADDYAIEFADWKDKLRPSQMVSFWSKNGQFKGKFDMDNEQLLEIFKKEKGL